MNVPDVETQDVIRIFFQVQLAHWFFLDFYCQEDSPMKNCTLKEFCFINILSINYFLIIALISFMGYVNFNHIINFLKEKLKFSLVFVYMPKSFCSKILEKILYFEKQKKSHISKIILMKRCSSAT